MPKATTNSPIDMSLDNMRLTDFITTVKFSPVDTLFSHSGDERIRLIRLISFPCKIVALRRGEKLAPEETYSLPSMGAETAQARECCGMSGLVAVRMNA